MLGLTFTSKKFQKQDKIFQQRPAKFCLHIQKDKCMCCMLSRKLMNQNYQIIRVNALEILKELALDSTTMTLRNSTLTI